ncbi:MAG: TetR/AcrR family transcriptional regulator [Sulfurisoma sp.]|nr:TetR/AcrR family transcriptional regulator [Sulfurisoma sp.]
MTKPRQRRKEARPAELAAAALELFVEKGFAATRLDDVAARAGVGKGTVYLYFESKEALFKAAIEAAMTPTVEAAEALVECGDLSAAERLREFVHGWWRMVAGTPIGGLPKLLVAESGNFPEIAQWHYETIIRRAMRALGRIIEAGIASGEFRPVPVEFATRIVFSPMFSIIVWTRAFGDMMCDLPDPKRFLDEALDVLINGLHGERK